MPVTGGSSLLRPPASAGNLGEKNAASLAAIREEALIAAKLSHLHAKSQTEDLKKELLKCVCRKYDEAVKTQHQTAEEIERLLKEKEIELRTEYDKILEREKEAMKDRFNFILSNEQTRACCMLREAHRERKEKITALQTQLECKNLAALMYVMCTERRRSKLEKLKLVRDYTKYIRELQDILTEGQELILHLSRGYKTAARVDHEWREKMKKVIREFMNFIYHFAGGSPETNQYFFDLQALLKTEAPIEDNPDEDPCEAEEDIELPDLELPPESNWWDHLEGDNRPFIMFGDMSDFAPCDRRQILKRVKAAKTAPKRWKTYVFNKMVIDAKCEHLDEIKDIYPERAAVSRWECALTPEQTEQQDLSKQSIAYRRDVQSADVRGKMSSLLKIMTAQNPPPPAHAPVTKTALLGARDSREIQSTTKLTRLSIKSQGNDGNEAEHHDECERAQVIEQPEVLAVGRRRTSVFEQAPPEPEEVAKPGTKNDSLEVIGTHVPDNDAKVYYEKICPMEKCQRLQVDSFMRSLPSYMRAHPFTHFKHTFEEYETCTPEQLEILKQRIESKKAKEVEDAEVGEEDPLSDWVGRGVAVQTSDLDVMLPPCTCHVPSPTPVSSNFVFNLEDLLPVKQAMDAIHKECLFDDRIEFNRFKVIGSESETSRDSIKKKYKPVQVEEIKNILMENPSLLDVFNPGSGSPEMT
ncbi:uncharacterized protein LOC113494671 isoform X2 [Trichoplusia ni]|uniref:Uncharacterized protein LOC113494671 isoform X2 n=1 Tax=Trichoplusia ni TaxID=7111 RepID=A0A7E5VKQ2_TRINI|nr:uncharacterized protein LOC113494671 isoform X2 [Trichoplusia ni]